MLKNRIASLTGAAGPLLGLSLAWATLAGGVHASQPTPMFAMSDQADPRVEQGAVAWRPNAPVDPSRSARSFMAERLPQGMDQYPTDRVWDIRKHMDAATAQRRGGELPGDLESWQPIGPGNIGGRTRVIAINPDNPDVIYAGGISGGVWKSVDAGQFWVPTGDDLPNLAVTDIVFDPRNPDVMYFSTGEGFLNVGAARGLGVFRSTDGGDTWIQLENTNSPLFWFTNKLAIAETEVNGAPGVELYAATWTGVWRSVDDGQTWDLELANPANIDAPGVQQAAETFVGFTDIAIGDDYVVAAAGSADTDGIYRADRATRVWDRVLSDPLHGRSSLSISPSNPDVIYASVAQREITNNNIGRLINVFRSLDGGETWQPRVNLANTLNQLLFSNVFFDLVIPQFGITCNGSDTPRDFTVGWFANTIKVDPVDPNVVWVGGVDLFRSDDGGQNFQLASYWYLDPTQANYLHENQHALAFHPEYNGTTNQTLYSGSDGGIARTQNARDTLTVNTCPFLLPTLLPRVNWTQLNNNYGVTLFVHGDVAREQDFFIGGSESTGNVRGNTRDPMVDWDRLDPFINGGYIAINPFDSDEVYTSAPFFGSIAKSIDGGDNSVLRQNGFTDEEIDSSTNLVTTPLVMDQSNPDTLWTGGEFIWRTTDGAALWQQVTDQRVISDGNPDLIPNVSAIAVSPGLSDIVYVGYNNGTILRSDNATDPFPSFSVISEFFEEPFGNISSLAVDPLDANTVYATVSTFNAPHIWRSVDAGETWVAIDGLDDPSGVNPDAIDLEGIPNIPVNVIAIRPTNTRQLYAGTDVGVFVSDNFGDTWSPASNGLPNTIVEWLEFRDRDTLVAFTYGRGAFLADLTPRTSIEIVPTQPLPTVVDRNTNTFIEVRIDVVADALVNAPRVFFRLQGRPSFNSFPLVSRGNGIFDAIVPGFECHADPEYFIQVEGAQAGIVRLPPQSNVQTEVVENINVFFDDGESDAGWTVSGDATDGAWERGFPDNNDRADPPTCFGGSGRCWLTDIDPNNENSDIDNGETILTSPELDIPRGAVFTFAYWYNATPDSGLSEGDNFRVEVSTDNFQDPANTFEIFRSETAAAEWREVMLVAGQDGFVLNPNGPEWIRVIAGDVGERNIVEAGLDSVNIGRRTCELCLADTNRDGVVNGLDFSGWLSLFNRQDPRADVNLDEVVNGLDFGAWLQAYEFGCD